MPIKVSLKKKKKTTKRAPVARSKTAEVSAVGQLIRQIGTMGGGALGGYAGMPVAGAAAGNSLGAAISKWLGFGDYTVGTNSIVQKASTGIPMMHKEGQTVTIRHREFIATVESSTTFNLSKSFQLNPGNSTTFPWLSTIANSFQEYRFKGVVFHYIPTSGNAISGTSPSLGSVMMQTSYRANDSPPSTKSELLNEYWSGEAVPSETFAHPIECNPAENPFNVQYVRRESLPASDNQLFYDLGVTHVCTQGQLAAGNTLGDIWVTYEVELKKPIVASNVTSVTTSYAGSALAPLATIADVFGGLLRSYGNIAVRRSSATSLTIDNPPNGSFLVAMTVRGTGMAGSFTLSSFNNATQVDAYPDGAGSYNLSATAIVYVFAFKTVNNMKPVSIFFSNSLTGTVSSSALDLTKLSD